MSDRLFNSLQLLLKQDIVNLMVTLVHICIVIALPNGKGQQRSSKNLSCSVSRVVNSLSDISSRGFV